MECDLWIDPFAASLASVLVMSDLCRKSANHIQHINLIFFFSIIKLRDFNSSENIAV